MTRLSKVYCLWILGTVAILAGCNYSSTSVRSTAGSSSGPAANQMAAKLFHKKCTHCHAADGTGNCRAGRKFKVPNLTAPQWQEETSDEEISTIIRNGKEEMPSFRRKFSNTQVADLVEYIRGLKQ